MKKALFIALGISIVSMYSCESKPTLTDAELTQAAEEEVERRLDSLYRDGLKDQFQWKYTTTADEMTSKKVKTAEVMSDDFASLEFPYEGSTTMTLYIRDNGGMEDAFIIVSQGQLSPDYNNPTLTVKFDSEAPELYSVSKESSGDSRYLFFDNAEKLIAKLKSAKTTKIQCVFYDNGTHVFSFNTSKLKW